MIRGIVLVVVLSFLYAPSYSQGHRSSCKEFADKVNETLGKFGPFPEHQSELPQFEKKNGVWSLKREGLSEEKIALILSASSIVAKLRLQHADSARCIFGRLGEDVMDWWSFFNSMLTGNTELP